VEEGAEFRWMEGVRREGEVQLRELDGDRVGEWTDGSRMEGRAAAATRTEATYLGTMSTIMGKLRCRSVSSTEDILLVLL